MSGPASKRRQRGYYGPDMGGMFAALIGAGIVLGLLLVPLWRFAIKPLLTWVLTLLVGTPP